MIALWYREHSYDFLVFTDHNTLANKERWVEIDGLLYFESDSYNGTPLSQPLVAQFDEMGGAIGRADKTWARARNPQWRPIDFREVNAHHITLYREYLCRGKFMIETPEQIVRALRAGRGDGGPRRSVPAPRAHDLRRLAGEDAGGPGGRRGARGDRKSTRLNSSH